MNRHQFKGDEMINISAKKIKEYKQIISGSSSYSASDLSGRDGDSSSLGSQSSQSQGSQNPSQNLSQNEPSGHGSFQDCESREFHKVDGPIGSYTDQSGNIYLSVYVWDQFHTKLFRIEKCKLIKGNTLNGTAEDPDDGAKYAFTFDGVRNKLVVTGTDYAIDWKPSRKIVRKSLLNPDYKRRPIKGLASKIDPSGWHPEDNPDLGEEEPLKLQKSMKPIKTEKTEKSKVSVQKQIKNRVLFA